jgi:hypothetical protein
MFNKKKQWGVHMREDVQKIVAKEESIQEECLWEDNIIDGLYIKYSDENLVLTRPMAHSGGNVQGSLVSFYLQI